MKYIIPYDGSDVELEFPSSADILTPPILPTISDNQLKAIVTSSFQAIKESFAGKRLAIIVNDATRRLPTPKILRILSELMPTSTAEILIATGTHRAPTNPELDTILGDMRPAFDGRKFAHDCRDESSLVKIGVTSRGTPVTVNKRLLDAECVICINSVEPHFFAGFTGGRKSIVPGLASLETTIANHSLAKDINACSLSIDNNPLHADLEEAVSFFKNPRIFSIQLVCSRDGGAIGAFCGDLKQSFSNACTRAREAYAVAIENKYDIVFAVGEPPLDINLYQLQKAQEHGAEAVKDGGILIVVGACNEGTGSEYFIKLAADYPAPEMALSDKAMLDNRFGIHKLVKTARRLRRIKVWYVTKLDDKTIRKVYYEPKSSLATALHDALRIQGRNARIAILRDACFMVPFWDNFKGGR